MYASSHSKYTFDFFVSTAVRGQTIIKVYVTVVVLLRGFMGNVDILEKRSENEKVEMESME